jgi:hypothetical protein
MTTLRSLNPSTKATSPSFEIRSPTGVTSSTKDPHWQDLRGNAWCKAFWEPRHRFHSSFTAWSARPWWNIHHASTFSWPSTPTPDMTKLEAPNDQLPTPPNHSSDRCQRSSKLSGGKSTRFSSSVSDSPGKSRHNASGSVAHKPGSRSPDGKIGPLQRNSTLISLVRCNTPGILHLTASHSKREHPR